MFVYLCAARGNFYFVSDFSCKTYACTFTFRARMYHSRNFPTQPFESSGTLEPRSRSGHDIGEKHVWGNDENYCPRYKREYVYLVIYTRVVI